MPVSRARGEAAVAPGLADATAGAGPCGVVTPGRSGSALELVVADSAGHEASRPVRRAGSPAEETVLRHPPELLHRTWNAKPVPTDLVP